MWEQRLSLSAIQVSSRAFSTVSLVNLRQAAANVWRIMLIGIDTPVSTSELLRTFPDDELGFVSYRFDNCVQLVRMTSLEVHHTWDQLQ